jgi:hypothetical protein
VATGSLVRVHGTANNNIRAESALPFQTCQDIWPCFGLSFLPPPPFPHPSIDFCRPALSTNRFDPCFHDPHFVGSKDLTLDEPWPLRPARDFLRDSMKPTPRPSRPKALPIHLNLHLNQSWSKGAKGLSYAQLTTTRNRRERRGFAEEDEPLRGMGTRICVEADSPPVRRDPMPSTRLTRGVTLIPKAAQ